MDTRAGLNDFLIGLSGAQVALFGMLTEHLSRRGLIDKKKLAAELKYMASAPEGPDNPYQAMIFEQVIGWLSPVKPQAPSGRAETPAKTSFVPGCAGESPERASNILPLSR